MSNFERGLCFVPWLWALVFIAPVGIAVAGVWAGNYAVAAVGASGVVYNGLFEDKESE